MDQKSLVIVDDDEVFLRRLGRTRLQHDGPRIDANKPCALRPRPRPANRKIDALVESAGLKPGVVRLTLETAPTPDGTAGRTDRSGPVQK